MVLVEMREGGRKEEIDSGDELGMVEMRWSEETSSNEREEEITKY